ncbi:hypothetical protein ES708_29971 [subsurface metagenome]
MFRYPPIIDFRWWITDISKEVTPLGLKLKVITNTDVNLFMVWTDVEPILEERWKMKRGVKVHCDPIFHLKNPQLVDEDVPEDHRVHYFTFDIWPFCQTRWFYFIAKVSFLWTKSTSFLHSYHKTAMPQWHVFSPDRYPGITCSDGVVGKTDWERIGTWENIHGGIGNKGGSSGKSLGMSFESRSTTGEWYSLYRGAIIFDTSSLPRPGIAQDAYVEMWGWNKYNGLRLDDFKIGLTDYDQDDNAAIAYADYAHYLPYQASKQRISYDNIIIGGWNRFELTDFHVNAIRDHPIREFGIREMTYDFLNQEPAWRGSTYSRVQFFSAEAIEDHPPKLHVNWLPTGG